MTKIPAFAASLKMMQSKNPQTMEDGFHYLLHYVNTHIDDLISEFGKPENSKIRDLLLELIGHSRSEKAFPLLVEQLHSDNCLLRQWAIYGLSQLESKEAKQVLREARYYELPSPQATSELHEDLDRIIGLEQSWEKFTHRSNRE